MRYLMASTAITSAKRLTVPLILSLTVAGCGMLSSHSPTWPSNLEVISLSDGGICLSPESAIRLAELKAELEAL